MVDELVDVAAFVGEWPFRRVPGTTPASLRSLQEKVGVTHVLVSPIQAMFQPVGHAENRYWATELADNPFFTFVPVLNPSLPGAEQELTQWQGPVRLLPGAHDYALDTMVDWVRAAGEQGSTVLVQVRMEDQRTAHHRFVLPEVSVDAIASVAEAAPDTRLVVVGARPPEIVAICHRTKPGQVWADFSQAEQLDLVRRLTDQVGAERLLVGSHAPIYVAEAIPAKLDVADLTDDELTAVRIGNARAAGLV
ncbi:hypothetical protein ACQBAR_04125 [Propionibacteriaceae bacterium Y1685]|uniref:hypothetical protein n=1 Tax=Microlunatus sp. Y1700 TaxID=3418487 RepID=UPI003B7C2A63